MKHAATTGAGGRVYVTGGTPWSGSDWYATARLDVHDGYRLAAHWRASGGPRES